MQTRVTLKDLASELGLSVQAVSLALRNRDGVSEQTRARVKIKAAERGYVPDPGMRALADYRTRGKKTVTRWNRVALVHNWESEKSWKSNLFYQRWFSELKCAAEKRGIGIETHWLGSQGERSSMVFRKLRSRGITGVFIAPPGMSPNPPQLEIPQDSPFQVVSFGPEDLYPQFHTVQFDFYGNLRLAWRVLYERGYKRIGLVYSKYQGWRTGHAWLAAYQIEKMQRGCPPGRCMPLELEEHSVAELRKLYLNWLKRGTYDAVISSLDWVDPLHRELGLQIPVALFNVRHSDRMGIDLNLGQMSETAMELLVLEMQRSLVREQSLPFRVHIPGRWVESATSD
ncbi:MAG: LacI family DNA-binding transcriptional regulator [Kiritimatiellia bacterium]